MGLNKKQKKIIEVNRGKIAKFKQLLSAAKAQNDDPAEIPRLEGEIAKLEAQIKEIKESA